MAPISKIPILIKFSFNDLYFEPNREVLLTKLKSQYCSVKKYKQMRRQIKQTCRSAQNNQFWNHNFLTLSTHLSSFFTLQPWWSGKQTHQLELSLKCSREIPTLLLAVSRWCCSSHTWVRPMTKSAFSNTKGFSGTIFLSSTNRTILLVSAPYAYLFFAVWSGIVRHYKNKNEYAPESRSTLAMHVWSPLLSNPPFIETTLCPIICPFAPVHSCLGLFAQ